VGGEKLYGDFSMAALLQWEEFRKGSQKGATMKFTFLLFALPTLAFASPAPGDLGNHRGVS
jgi:hypothetical protein